MDLLRTFAARKRDSAVVQITHQNTKQNILNIICKSKKGSYLCSPKTREAKYSDNLRAILGLRKRKVNHESDSEIRGKL